MALNVGNGGVKLVGIVDENLPATFAPGCGQAAAFADVAGEGMKI